MATLKIFGPTAGRTSRVLWAAKELELDFDRVDVDADMKAGAYRDINPNARFPAMQDGDLMLFESLAINLYLARTHGASSLYPVDTADEARAVQWSLWAANELEALLIACLADRVFKPADARNEAAAAEAEAKLARPLAVLEAALTKSPYLLGSAFSIADLNVASVMGFAPWAAVDLSAYPRILEWLTACQARPAAIETVPQPYRLAA